MELLATVNHDRGPLDESVWRAIIVNVFHLWLAPFLEKYGMHKQQLILSLDDVPQVDVGL